MTKPRPSILVLFSGDPDNERAATRRTDFLTALRESNPGYDYTVALYVDLVYYFASGEAGIRLLADGRDIAAFDLVMFRLWQNEPEHASAVARYLDTKQVPYFDAEVGRTASFSKLTEYAAMQSAGLPIPRTLLVSAHTVAGLDVTGYGLTYPVVAKAKDGRMGRDNHLVADHKALVRLMKDNPQTGYIVQEFIPNDGDYRVVVVDGTVVTVLHRRRADDTTHLNNTSQGGRSDVLEVTDLAPEIAQDCIAAAAALGRDLAGVDVIISRDTAKHFIIEVNNAPQLNTSSQPERLMAELQQMFRHRLSNS